MSVPEHLKAATKIARKACIAETGAKEEHIEASKNGHLEDNPEMRCYVKCVLQQLKMIKEGDEVDFEMIMHLLPPHMKDSVALVTRECKTLRK